MWLVLRRYFAFQNCISMNGGNGASESGLTTLFIGFSCSRGLLADLWTVLSGWRDGQSLKIYSVPKGSAKFCPYRERPTRSRRQANPKGDGTWEVKPGRVQLQTNHTFGSRTPFVPLTSLAAPLP